MVFIGGFYCIPSLMSGRKDLKNFMISYVDDMPSIDICDAEIDFWETFWFSSTITKICPLQFAKQILLQESERTKKTASKNIKF